MINKKEKSIRKSSSLLPPIAPTHHVTSQQE
jgi:hypothetical protein